MRRIPELAATLCFVSALTASAVSAQVVTGTITDEVGAPVMGALVRLLDEAGEPRGGVLSNAQGRYLLRAPGPGSYRLTGQRIGLATVTTEVLGLSAGGTYERSFVLRSAPIALEGIVAWGERKCDLRAGEGTALVSLWEEARKAFDVVAHTRAEGLFRLQVRRYERELDASSDVVVTERSTFRSGFWSGSPFVALDPERLIEDGFVQPEPDGALMFYMPDVDALLSDIFHEAHCFHLVRGDDDAMVGIGIEPVRRREGLRGTLWLDRETHEIRRLDYSLSHDVMRRGGMPPATGVIRFEGLPSGAWIVRRWHVRMPVMADRTTRLGQETRAHRVVQRFLEEGGEVMEIAPARGIAIARAAVATLAGRVYDEEAGGPLAGAVVFVTGTTHAAVTDADGRYELTDLSAGRYTVTFQHPSLDRYRVEPDPLTVEMVAGRAATADLVVPAGLRLTRLRERCAGESPDDRAPHDHAPHGQNDGVIAGIVRDPATGRPATDVEVEVTWDRYGIDPAALRQYRRGAWVRTDPDGWFVACGVAADRTVRVRVTVPGSAAARPLEVRLEGLARPYTFVSLELPR